MAMRVVKMKLPWRVDLAERVGLRTKHNLFLDGVIP